MSAAISVSLVERGPSIFPFLPAGFEFLESARSGNRNKLDPHGRSFSRAHSVFEYLEGFNLTRQLTSFIMTLVMFPPPHPVNAVLLSSLPYSSLRILLYDPFMSNFFSWSTGSVFRVMYGP